MKNLVLCTFAVLILTACQAQTIIVTPPVQATPKPSATEVTPVQYVVLKGAACPAGKGKLVNVEETQNAKICYYLREKDK